MKLFILPLITLLLTFSPSHAQRVPPNVKAEKAFIGYRFFSDGQKINRTKAVSLLRSDKEAYAHVQKARANKVFSDIFGISGGFMVGYTLGAALANAEPDGVIAGVGAGLSLLSLPFELRYNKKVAEAVNMHNEATLEAGQTARPMELYFGPTGSGVGFTLAF